MTVLNDLDRFHLVGDFVDRLPQLDARAAELKRTMQEKLVEHRECIRSHGDDMAEIRDGRWNGAAT